MGLQDLPIAINGYLGDALIQWEDTIFKLESLYDSNHMGNIMVPTKKIMSATHIKVLSSHFKNIWIFFAITGLDELHKGSLKDYEKSYLQLCDHFKNVVCAIRPIIPGKNDKIEIIEPILKMVNHGNKLLMVGGYKDIYDKLLPQYRNETLFEYMRNYCLENGIKFKEKCIDIISDATNKEYLVSEVSQQNLKMASSLGYKFEQINNSIIPLDNYNGCLTKGDLNFVKLITHGKVTAASYLNSQVISVKIRPGINLVCSSSWFHWAKQTSCPVKCFYCFADYKSLIRTELEEFGCNPAILIN